MEILPEKWELPTVIEATAEVGAELKISASPKMAHRCLKMPLKRQCQLKFDEKIVVSGGQRGGTGAKVGSGSIAINDAVMVVVV